MLFGIRTADVVETTGFAALGMGQNAHEGVAGVKVMGKRFTAFRILRATIADLVWFGDLPAI